ncbi:hypothetical protein GINT2_000488 [Glugoides intestinalis]
MISSDFLRNIVFSPPNKICEDATIYSFLGDELVANMNFFCFLLTILAITIFVVVVVYIRRRGEPTKLMIYLLGMNLFFIALIFQLSKSKFNSEIINIDEKLYNALRGIHESGTSVLTGAVIYLFGKFGMADGTSSSELNKKSTLSLIRPLIPINVSNSLNKDYGREYSNFLQGSEEKQKINGDQNNFTASGTAKVIISHSGKKPAIRVLETTTTSSIVFKDPKADKKPENPKQAVEVVVKNIEKSTAKSININAPTTKSYAVTEKKKQIQVANEDDKMPSEQVDEMDDVYFKNILKIFGKEFTSNNKVAVRFKEINEALKKTDCDVKKLDNSLKKFTNMSNVIEKELKSFNASAKNVENVRDDLIRSIKKIMALESIYSNLNFQGSEDIKLNSIFNGESTSTTIKPIQKTASVKSTISFVQAILLIETVLCIVFFFNALSGNQIFFFRFFTVLMLCINMYLGVIIMAHAHFFDRDCILGLGPNCEAKFSKSFTDFARSANIDLRSQYMEKTESLGKKFDKIEERTVNIITPLKEYFEIDYNAEFKLKSMYLKNLINKIIFVNEDFNDITHSKINKNEYYLTINTIDLYLSKIAQNLATLDNAFLLDFFIKKAIFKSFIENEKVRIVLNAEKQLEISIQRSMKKKQKGCEELRMTACDKKKMLDSMSIILIIGSLFFLIGFLF